MTGMISATAGTIFSVSFGYSDTDGDAHADDGAVGWLARSMDDFLW